MSNIQISNIYLWQKNGILRNLNFLHNRVNVITGDSGKGKSSILYIIDYCLLASGTKGISKTNIDSKVAWYGIKISISGKELVIARPSESAGETDQAYFSENGVAPEIPVLNVRISNLKKVLSAAFGIDPALKVPYGGKFIQAGSKVSFRNFLAYSYQDQNAIVAPDYLFIRPTDERYQESIDRTFRMAIGAENVDTALARHRLAELERKIAAQARKLELYRKSEHTFSEEISALSSEAHVLGVIDRVPETFDDRITVLHEAVHNASTPSDQMREVERIEEEIFSIAARNKKLTAFIDNRPDYMGTLKNLEDSLKPVSVFNTQADNIFPSPLANEVISRLQRELNGIKSSLQNRKTFPFLDEVKNLLAQNEAKVRELQQQLEQTERQKPVTHNLRNYYRYLGRLEAKLELYRQSDEAALPEIPDSLDESIATLQKVVDQNEQKSDLAKQELNNLINKRLLNLKLKGYELFSAYFDEKDKLIHMHSPDRSTVESMPDVGSASNYLYLHVSYFLAIHEIAKTRNIPWIPSFLVLDQVSTPYFSTNRLPNDDIRSLDKVLTELNNFVVNMDEHGGFQIILLEHIGIDDWKSLDLERFHLVDKELRNDYGLILEHPEGESLG